jgi:hypothetical protein
MGRMLEIASHAHSQEDRSPCRGRVTWTLNQSQTKYAGIQVVPWSPTLDAAAASQP